MLDNVEYMRDSSCKNKFRYLEINQGNIVSTLHKAHSAYSDIKFFF